jgi:hypothetical protein
MADRTRPRAPGALGLLLLVACGAPPRPPAPPSNVAADLAAARAGPLASATLVILSAAPLTGDAEKASEALRTRALAAYARPPADLAVAPIDQPVELVVRALPIDELPLDPAVLSQILGPEVEALTEARSATLVRATDRARGDGRALRGALVAAGAVAGLDDVVVDVTTWRALRRRALGAALADPGWLADQVVPVVARTEDGALLFHSRGMGRFGLPDLMRVGVPEAEGREAFQAFQETLAATRAAGPAATSAPPLAGRPPCPVPTGAVDGACLTLP